MRVAEAASAFDQANVAGARPFLGVFGREFNPLPFPQQLEHRTAHRAAVEEVLDSTLVADEPEPFVDEKPAIVPVGIPESPPFRTPGSIPRVSGRLRAPTKKTRRVARTGRIVSSPFELENAPV